jgi:CarboxypepD_reg-like domain
MKNSFLLLTVLLWIARIPMFGQNGNTLLKGIIMEEGSKTPLIYVNIGILNKPIGTVSDTLGNYSLTINQENITDTLQVSSVGYVTKKIAVNTLIQASDKTIRLTKKITVLQEVVVSNKKGISETVGRESDGKFIQISLHNKTSVDETIGSELGIKVKVKKGGATLKDFNWYMSANNFNSIKFRVNIYALKNNMPDTLISNKEIFITVENFKTGWTKIDLTPYNIAVNNDFVITLQWVESKMDKKENPVTIIPVAFSFSKNCYARVASQDKWKRVGIKPSCFVTLLY